ncbi:hypothetical protein [Halorussus lipolyticus]|uniref:hypothetical protein n=1 Tax=Halorussus lipolyticus TaxID=3034024 RepID=UPI0023E86979|nr:hypothetical protein [Halorussus sp. DT80]
MTTSEDSGEQARNRLFSSESMTDNHSTATAEAQNCETCAGVTRRAFMAGAAGAAATAAGAGNAVATGEDGTAEALSGSNTLAQDTTTTDTPDWSSGRSGLNWDSAYAPNPYFEATLEKARHRTEWGTDDAALLDYENDNGETSTLGGTVDREESENVVSFRADKIEFADGSAFPRSTQYDEDGDGEKDTDVTALAPTHWSTTGATNGSISVSSADLDVSPALEVSTSSVADGETVNATFDLTAFGAAITDSAAKRFAQLVVNTVSLDSGALVEFVFRDSDGDEKVLKIGSSLDATQSNVVATATGYGQTAQQRFGDLSTVANGDGSFDGLAEVEIRVSDANATVQIPALNAEKMGRWTFGTYLQNEGTDDEERTKRYEPSGEVTATSLDTFSEAFTEEGTTFYDLSYPVRVTMADADLDYEYRFRDVTDRVGYDSILETRGKVVLTQAYDLNWQSPAFKQDVTVPTERYESVELATGIEDVAFADVDDSSWTAYTSNFDSEGATVTMKDPAASGVVYGVREFLLLRESDRKEVEDSGGGGKVPDAQSSGGSPLAAIAAVATGVIGFLTAWAKGLV